MTQEPLRVVILGASSAIAEATARLYAAEGAIVLLAGRNAARLAEIAEDLKMRGAKSIEVAVLDLARTDAAAELATFAGRLGGIDHVLIAYGIMPAQSEAEHSPDVSADVFAVNFSSASSWALAAATLFEAQGAGSLVVLGSPAGDRGRRKNFVYGASKAGLAVLVQGIAHRFAGKGPRAVLLKPGPTASPLTAGSGDRTRLASPDQIARAARRAAERGGPIQYAPARWRLIMRVVREIPWWIFNRMNF